MDISIPLSSEQLTGLAHVAGEQPVEEFVVAAVQVMADNGYDRAKAALADTRRAAFAALSEQDQAFFTSIIFALKDATDEQKVAVQTKAVELAQVLGVK